MQHGAMVTVIGTSDLLLAFPKEGSVAGIIRQIHVRPAHKETVQNGVTVIANGARIRVF